MKPRHSIPALALLMTILATTNEVPASEGAPYLHELRERAEGGDPVAAVSLGMHHRDGRGTKQDHAKALRWFRVSADAGHDAGLDNVGFMYLRGWGVPRDSGIAAAFFRAAAEMNHGQGLYNLGECHFSGRGVPQDYARAIETWERAAEGGHENSIWRLAMIYAAGESVPQDLERAETLCRGLAEREHVNGMLLLGEIRYREGDPEAARGLWEKAAEKGSAQAKSLLELSEWRGEETVPGVRSYVHVDHFFQGWNNCGATSVAMFERHAGGELTPYDVKRFCPQSPIGTGTDWEHLVAVGDKIGRSWELLTFPRDETGFSEGVGVIREHLDQDRPVVIDFTVVREENGSVSRHGHTLLVVGYDRDSERFVLKNPNQPSPGIELMTAGELKANWFSGGYSRSASGVVARPLIVARAPQ